MQQLGDLRARVRLGDELDHLQLARRQRVRGHGSPVARALEEVADQRRHRRRVQERLAAQRRPARLDEIAVGAPT